MKISTYKYTLESNTCFVSVTILCRLHTLFVFVVFLYRETLCILYFKHNQQASNNVIIKELKI
jgi:hypothetical protein